MKKETIEQICIQVLLILFGVIVIAWGIMCPYTILTVIFNWIGLSFIIAGLTYIIANILKKYHKEQMYVVVGWKEENMWNPDEKVEFNRLCDPCSLEECMSGILSTSEVADAKNMEITIVSLSKWEKMLKKGKQDD